MAIGNMQIKFDDLFLRYVCGQTDYKQARHTLHNMHSVMLLIEC